MNITKRLKLKRYAEPEGQWYMVEAEVNMDRIVVEMAAKARSNRSGRATALSGDIQVTVRLCADQGDK
ncbi:MAG TPA: hypothetical protein VHT52_11970 [Stellaceae bacterium]|nr:hypothetical protein [Stellaceae bacterium]